VVSGSASIQHDPCLRACYVFCPAPLFEGVRVPPHSHMWKERSMRRSLWGGPMSESHAEEERRRRSRSVDVRTASRSRVALSETRSHRASPIPVDEWRRERTGGAVLLLSAPPPQSSPREARRGGRNQLMGPRERPSHQAGRERTPGPWPLAPRGLGESLSPRRQRAGSLDAQTAGCLEAMRARRRAQRAHQYIAQ